MKKVNQTDIMKHLRATIEVALQTLWNNEVVVKIESGQVTVDDNGDSKKITLHFSIHLEPRTRPLISDAV